jgi:DNA-binding transcriptional MerR regulator
MATTTTTEPAATLTIGDLAARVDVATSTLRYYEELGLLEPAARVSGQRRYAPAAVGLVGAILLLRDVGFTLRETKELLDGRAVAPGAWRALVQHKVAELDRQIAAAQIAREGLAHALDHCPHDDLTQCPSFQAAVTDHLAGQPLAESGPHRPA